MKFGYSYKTSDGTRHESVYHAPSREDVFAGLREKGIRPIKVWEMENPKSNGRKTVAVAIAAIVVVLGIAFALLRGRSVLPSSERQEEDRSQIYGDPGILQACEASNWKNVFEDPGELFLARYAQPGIEVNAVGNSWRTTVAAALKAKPQPIRVSATDSAEIAKMKRMVNGMKRELAEYVRDGGTVEEYIGEVLERQSVEAKIVFTFKSEFEKLEKAATKDNVEEIISKWNAKNVLLRQMGLRTVLIPEKIETLGL